MARTQSFSVKDFSGGMVKGVGDRDLAPNEAVDVRGFSNTKRTALIPMHSLGVVKIARADDTPSGYDFAKVPIGSYGLFGFGVDHQLEEATPVTYAFTSAVVHTGRPTKWVLTIDYGWNTAWAGTLWHIDCEGFGTVGTFTSEDDGVHDATYGWTLAINDTLVSAKAAIDGTNKIAVNATIDPGMSGQTGVTSTNAGTSSIDAKINVFSDKHGSDYADLELSMYSSTSNPPTE